MAISTTYEGRTDAGEVPVLDLDPFDEELLANPYAFHSTLREAGPVVFLSRYGIFASARHQEVTTALKDHEAFCSSRGVGLSDFAREEPWRPPSLLLETDPPVHSQMRGIMNRIVNPAALKDLRQAWLVKAEALIDALVARGSFDAVQDLAEAFPMQVFPEVIGLRDDGREHILPYASAAFNAFGPRNEVYERNFAGLDEASAWVAEACQRDFLKPGGWGMAVHEAADAGYCTADEAPRLVRSLLTAGVDTTVNGIGNMLNAFATHPDQWDLLRSEPALRKKAFEEALRWDSTVQTFFRTVTRDTDMGGVVLHEGDKILLFLAAANRDPRKWTDPDRFDITRMCSGHVAFGFGIHQCLGQMVARLEADVILEATIPRIASIKLAGPAKRRINNTLHALESLPVSVTPA